jgi:hypothetical protein
MKRKKMFTPMDDDELIELVNRFGEDQWMIISQQMSRPFTTRQCRERWRNYLNPGLDRALWTDADDASLVEAYNRIGNRWSSIAALFPGRTGNFVRNRCLTVLRRSLKAEEEVVVPETRVSPQVQRDPRFSLCDGSKLPPDEEEIIDLFLGRALNGSGVPERGETVGMNEN